MASKVEVPPNGTFFDTLKRNFADVPVDKSKNNAISTSEFLEASESLVTLFGAYLDITTASDMVLEERSCTSVHPKRLLWLTGM